MFNYLYWQKKIQVLVKVYLDQSYQIEILCELQIWVTYVILNILIAIF